MALKSSRHFWRERQPNNTVMASAAITHRMQSGLLRAERTEKTVRRDNVIAI